LSRIFTVDELALSTAAAVAFFFLDKKETKNQDNKYASTLPAGS